MVAEPFRMFNCAQPECRRQVLVCRRCDRGQRYCGRDCAELERKRQVRVAAELVNDRETRAFMN